MKKDSIIDFLGFIIVRLAALFFKMIPSGLALYLGRRCGDFVYLVNVKRRSIAYANLKAAFPEKGFCEIKRLVRRHYQRLGMSVVELLRLPRDVKKYTTRYVQIDNFERIEEAQGKQKGVILLTGHFGNWELSSIAAAAKGKEISVFAREQKYARLNRLLNRYRQLTGCKVITKGFSVRDVIRILKDNGIIGMLFDQDAGPNGVFVDFMGRPASTARGVVDFAMKLKSVILPCFIRRTKNLRYHLAEINEPFELIDTGNKDEDIKINLERLSKVLEDYITRFPEEWLWSHKRWKSTPERRILILSDKKPGHRNQAIALGEMFEEALRLRLNEKGIKADPIIKTRIVDLEFKNRFCRIFLDIASIFSGPRCQGCLRCMRFSLTRRCFEELKGYADIVICCGAQTVGAGVFLKYENNAKAVVLMKPGLGRGKRFDKVILQRHDAPVRLGGNIVVTDIAPNRILVRKDIKDRNAAGIGLLIGGDAKNFVLKKDVVKDVLEGVLKISKEMGLGLFVSSSRRTSREIDALIKEAFASTPFCKMLVIANENNKEGAVDDILRQSKVVVISPESVSMISEAVSSGRYVVVFNDDKDTTFKRTKYARFIKGLEERTYIVTVDSASIYKTLKNIFLNPPPLKEIKDKEIVIEALKSLI